MKSIHYCRPKNSERLRLTYGLLSNNSNMTIYRKMARPALWLFTKLKARRDTQNNLISEFPG